MTIPFRFLLALLLVILAPSVALPQAEGLGPEAAAAPEEGVEEAETHVDDQGRRYRLVEYPKGREGVDHLRLPNGQLRIQFGVPLEIDHETEESFFLKVYVRPEPSVPPRMASPGPARGDVTADEPPMWPVVDHLVLSPFDDGLPRQGQWRDGFDLEDMNGDGKLDIVFGPARKGRPEPNIFLNMGGGSWSRWQTKFPGIAFDYGDASAADFNRDGRMDLALAIHLGGTVVFVGDGEGRFRTWSDGIGLAVPGAEGTVAFSSRALEAVDWDSDGWIDLMVLGEGPRPVLRPVAASDPPADSRGLLLYRNRGDGTWDRRGDQSRNFGESLALGDFDNDGRVDVLAASKVQGLNEIINLHLEDGGWAPRALDGLRPGAFVFGVAAADLDGDGLEDLLLGSIHRDPRGQRTGVDAFFASEDESWQRVPLFSVAGRAGIYGLASGDLNADGREDVVFGTGDGELQVLLGAPDRGFIFEQSEEIQQNRLGCRAYGLSLADLDGDGADEIVAGFAGEAGGLELFHTVPGCPESGSIKVWRPASTD